MRILSQTNGASIADRLRRVAGDGATAVLELVMPSSCRLCNQPISCQAHFCRRCELELTVSQRGMESACLRCGIPKPKLAASAESLPSSDEDPVKEIVVPSCVHCCKQKFLFHGVVGLWAYHGRVCDAVVAAKYAHCAPLGDAMGRRLGARVADVFADDLPTIITIVPSHQWRRFQRGGSGNQAIAAAVAAEIRHPFKELLRATRRTEKQAWLDDVQRRKNVLGAFSLKKSYALPRLPNAHVLVIDDVLTTGATANEAARVLRAAGARRVSLAVVARAIRG